MNFQTHPFSLRHLQYAVALAETLSFRKAAERCHVSQPSLSAQLAGLEKALGVRLFERDRRRVLLTDSGRALVERARRVLLEVDDLVDAARQMRDPLSGTLRLGVIPTISPYLLPHVTPALHREYPGLTVLWVEEKTDVLLRRLEEGDLDGALLALETDLGDLDWEVVAKDPFVLATPPGHPLGTKPSPVTPGELEGVNVLLLDDGHCFREQALAYCSKARARELEFRATSLSTLVQMVAQGASVTLLPLLSVPTEGRGTDLCVRPFATPAPHRTIALVWRKTSPHGTALRRITATLRAAYPAQEGQPSGGNRPRPRKGPAGRDRERSASAT